LIVVQSPLRISFLGGGTDFEEHYAEYGGAVLSTAINKCIFVIVKERFDNLIYVNYSIKEIAQSPDEVKNALVREALKMTQVVGAVEITNLADIPTTGTGLGSSSAFTVALLQALYAHRGETKTAEMLAQEACQIEIDILGAPIGKQDQYITAYGDIRFITFSNEDIKVENIELPAAERRRLDDNLLLFYTGVAREANVILDEQLAEQEANIKDNLDILREMTNLAYKAKDAIASAEFDAFGEIMHSGWMLKKQMASKITNGLINEMYNVARKAGAIGGKVTGAGGGGFILLYCPSSRQEDVRLALSSFRELPFHFERDGCKVIFNYRRAL